MFPAITAILPIKIVVESDALNSSTNFGKISYYQVRHEGGNLVTSPTPTKYEFSSPQPNTNYRRALHQTQY